jgi:hypothetical protein
VQGFPSVAPGTDPGSHRGGAVSTTAWIIMVIAIATIVAIAFGAFGRR